MQTEYITRTKLIAADGMILTDGKIYGKEIYLADGESILNYYEIPQSQYEQILAKQEEENNITGA